MDDKELINIAIDVVNRNIVDKNEMRTRCLCSCRIEFFNYINIIPVEKRSETIKIMKSIFRNRLFELQKEVVDKLKEK